MARAADGSIYLRIRAVEGDELDAVREKDGVSETIGTGDPGEAYNYCKNHWRWDEVNPEKH
jgi:hypothetical protein